MQPAIASTTTPAVARTHLRVVVSIEGRCADVLAGLGRLPLGGTEMEDVASTQHERASKLPLERNTGEIVGDDPNDGRSVVRIRTSGGSRLMTLTACHVLPGHTTATPSCGRRMVADEGADGSSLVRLAKVSQTRGPSLRSIRTIVNPGKRIIHVFQGAHRNGLPPPIEGVLIQRAVAGRSAVPRVTASYLTKSNADGDRGPRLS
jgi:hypothetical protein